MDLMGAFDKGQSSGLSDRVEKIIAITERMDRIDCAISKIKYNNELLLEVPEALKTLGAAMDAAIAELKTV
jgi:hypothetical protein